MSFINSLSGNILKGGVVLGSKRKLAKIDGQISLPGLEYVVEIKRDKYGVPHILAQNMHDLFFAQGFVHAQDRLWQMELNRRTARGQLAELFGEIAVDTDRTARTFGFDRIGKKDWEDLDQEVKDVMEAYTKGINAFLNYNRNIAIEYNLIRHKPRLWTVEDTMALSRLMIWKLSHAWYGELLRAQIIEAVGPEHAADLEITYPDENPTILPEGIEFNIRVKDVLKKHKGPFIEKAMGSNSWVISKERSGTGHAILANDMHLPLSLPALWYENHLRSKEINVTGVTVPGLPMVLVGHNEKIAWGATLAFTDAEDLFIEKLDLEEKIPKYQYKGKWVDAEFYNEEILVGKEDRAFEKVIITNHGPIITNHVKGTQDQISVCSMALRPSNAMRGWYKLNLASNWDDFVDAVRDIDAPQLNITYADVEDNIGYWCSGKVPVRKKGDGKVPVPGWDGEYDWKGEIAFEKMPHAFNPEQGYIITANHRIVDKKYKPYLGGQWMNGYRAKRIEEVITSQEKFYPSDCETLQNDFTCLPAQEFIKHFDEIEINDPDDRVNKAFRVLKAFDGVMNAESVGATLYEVTRYMTVKNLLEPNLGRELAHGYMGEGFHPLLLPSHEFFAHDTVAMLRILADEENWWLKHAGGKEALLKKSFNRAFEHIRDKLGLDVDKWVWGRLHSVTFEHSMAIQKPMDVVFNKGPYPVGGNADTPCQMSFHPQDPFDVKAWAPSWRQIIDLGDLASSKAMFAPGQSGQLGSKHYADLIEPWLKGEYHGMFWTRGQIENNEEGTLFLQP